LIPPSRCTDLHPRKGQGWMTRRAMKSDWHYRPVVAIRDACDTVRGATMIEFMGGVRFAYTEYLGELKKCKRCGVSK
jgi:hypothetical protein